jgi:hypothetical protein
MKTKFFAFVLVLLVLFPQTYAQKKSKIDTGIHFGLLGGINLQKQIGKNTTGDPLNYKFDLDFNAGANVIISFAPDLYFQPGLIYSVKGTKQDITDEINRTVKLSYVEIPLNLLYRPQLGNGHILIGLGPYVAYGIMGKERTKTDNITIELKVKFQNNAPTEFTSFVYYRGLDAGGNIYFGYELFNGIFFQLNAQCGILRINPSYDNTPTDKTAKRNIGFGLSAGYRF